MKAICALVDRALGIGPFLFAAALLAGVSHTWAAPPLYLSDDIAAALHERDALLADIDAPGDVATTGFVASPQLSALDEFIGRNRRTLRSDPWFVFYRGVASSGDNPARARRYFSRALSLAAEEPGVAWAMHHEFRRYGHEPYADSALAMLHKHLLVTGAHGSRIVAQQLMHEAVTYQRAGQTERANQAWDRARRFDRDAVWPSMWRIKSGLTFSPTRLGAGVSGALRRLGSSWETQVTFAHYLLKWLFRFVQVLVVGVFAAMFLKYFTHAIHPYVEMFPQAVPIALRSLLVASVVVALGAFGAIPLLWVLAFILWPTMWPRERLVAGICMVLIALSPIGAWFEATLRSVRSPENTLYLYSRALEDGAHEGLHAQTTAHADARSSDHVAQIAAALTSLKNDSLHRAYEYAAEAERLVPNDPMAQTVSGVVHFRGGKRAAAQQRFERCVKLYPSYASGYFNLGQTLFEAMNTLEGADLIDKAQKVGGRPVKRFVHTNDSLFNQARPPLRRFIIADYAPGYFWKNIFGMYVASWTDTTRLWGISFLGLPPLWSLGVFAVLLVLLLMRESVVSSRRRSRAKKVMSCELCRAPMCKRCSRGPYCGRCYDKLSSIQVESKRQSAKLRLHEHIRRRDSMLANLLDVVFAGMGMLYERGQRLGRVGIIFVFLTALIYGLVIALSTYTYAYPMWISKGLYVPVYGAGVVYVLVFLVRGIVRSHRTLTAEGK